MAKRIEAKKSVAVARAHVAAVEAAKAVVEATAPEGWPTVGTETEKPTCTKGPEPKPKMQIVTRSLLSGAAKLVVMATQRPGKPAAVVVSMIENGKKLRGCRAEYPTFSEARERVDFLVRDGEAKGWVGLEAKVPTARKAKKLQNAFDVVPAAPAKAEATETVTE